MPNGEVRIFAPDAPEAPIVPGERTWSPPQPKPATVAGRVPIDPVDRTLADVDRYMQAVADELGVEVTRLLVVAFLALDWGTSIARRVLSRHKAAQGAVLKADGERDAAAERFRGATSTEARGVAHRDLLAAIDRGTLAHHRLRQTLAQFLWLSAWWPGFAREWVPTFEREHGALMHRVARKRDVDAAYWQRRAVLEQAGVA